MRARTSCEPKRSVRLHRMPALAFPAGATAARHFVGRDRELADVQARLHEASLGSGSFLLVSGAAGVGKSRFLRECAAIRSAAAVLVGQCSPSAATGRSLRTQLTEQLESHGPRVRTHDRAAFHATLGQLLKRRPAAVLVDDVHLASASDLETLDAVASLAHRQRLVLIGCTLAGAPCSSRSVPARIRHWLSQGAQGFELTSLDDTAVELLIRSMLNAGAHAVSGDRLREILAVAQGNPRFAVELALQTAGSGRRATIVPPSAGAAVSEAHQYLSRLAFEVLSLCSVIGERFHHESVAAVHGAPLSQIADALQEARDLGVLCEDDAAPGWFFFRQRAVRNAVYAAMVTLRQRILHERVAVHLTSREGDAAHALLLGQQHEALGNHAAAAECFDRAAQGLREDGAFGAAAHTFARASTHVAAGSPRWLGLRRSLLACYERTGEYANVIEVATTIRSTADLKAEPETEVALLWNLFFAYLNDGAFDSARAIAHELESTHSAADPDCASKAALILVYVLTSTGRYDEAEAVLATVDESALASEEGKWRYLIATATLGRREGLAAALAQVEHAAIVMPSAPVTSTTFAYIEGANLALQHGDLKLAREYSERATAAAAKSQVQDSKVTRHVVRGRALIHILEGDVRRGRELLLSALAWRNAGRHNEAALAGLYVFAAMRVGDFALVDAMFDAKLLTAAAAASDAELCGLLLPGFAEVMQARGMSRELYGVLQSCIERELMDPYAWIALTAARYAPLDVLERVRTQAQEFVRTTVAPIAPAHKALVDALIARRQGALRSAHDRASEAADVYARFGWRLFEALALETGDDVSAAVKAYAACGASADVARLASGHTRKRRRSPFGAHLTPREREVARLVARRRTDKDIARALEISVRTVHHHVEAVFSKLGVPGRSAVTESFLEDALAR